MAYIKQLIVKGNQRTCLPSHTSFHKPKKWNMIICQMLILPTECSVHKSPQMIHNSFKGLGTLVKFSIMFHKGDNFSAFLCSQFAFLHTKPLLKMCLHYKESKFFPYKVDPFSDEKQKQPDRVSIPESTCHFPFRQYLFTCMFTYLGMQI